AMVPPARDRGRCGGRCRVAARVHRQRPRHEVERPEQALSLLRDFQLLTRLDLNNTVALITGGKRIGAVVARELASRGVDVAFSYARSKAEAEQAADAVRGLKRRAATFQADLSQPPAAAALVDAVAVHLGRLDILINMAS